MGEDGLSAQSMYGVNIEDKNEIELLLPRAEMFGNEVYLGKKTLMRMLTQFTCALNDVRVQISSNSTLFAVWQGRFVNTLIAQVMAEGVVINSNDIEFHDWSQNSSYAHFWFCPDVENSPMLKLAIEKAIKKSPHHDSSGNLFGHGLRKHQFVGFVSSNTKSNALISFHLHSFVTFYTFLEINTTVITSTLTTRHHILSNMQDHLLQLIQLMQYRMIESFSVTLSNSIIGSDVTISQDSLDGFLALGFDKSQFDEDGRGFTLSTMHPICIVQYHNSYTWAKYC